MLWLATTLLLLPGCYYEHLARGQARLWWTREPLDAALTNPDLTAAQRNALALVPEVRSYAATLSLEVDDQYTHFVPWPGDRILTNLVATPPRSLEPHSFHFPIVGALPYKAFFDPERAQREADALKARGFDVCVSAVPAYSTLGWLADPVTAPMLQWGPAALVEMLIHELVHATIFVHEDGSFNEGLATFVGQEGTVRFFGGREGPEGAERERARVRDDRRIAAALAAFRARIERHYAATAPDPGVGGAASRAALERQARETLAALPLESHDASQVAASARLNDACLALAATYEGDLEAYAERLDALDGDLRAFVESARDAARSSNPRETMLSQSAP